MKKMFAVLSLLLLSTSVFAWTIGPMNYQGRLLDNAGIPVTGSYNFKVRIYDALSGGTLKLSEDQSSITVNDGVYSFLVSTGTNPVGTWDINLWNTPTLYLEIEVNSQILTPRHLLASAPFAFQANLALTTNNALALGGKSSGAVLQDICKTGKGKWLDLVSQCLGVGAIVTNQNSTSLASDRNYTNLDLSNADLTGTTWGSQYAVVDFSGTLFKNTKITLPNLMGWTNFTNAVMDGVISPGGNIPINFTGATISNTDMTGWDLGNAYLGDASIADLTACPSNFQTVDYACKPQLDGKFFVVGPNMNFSETSLLKNRLNIRNLSQNIFSGVVFGATNFRGNSIEGLSFSNNNFWHASFDGVIARDLDFINSILEGAKFSGSTIQNVHFNYMESSADPFIFESSILQQIVFSALNYSPSLIQFNKSTLSDVKFMRVANDGPFQLTFSNSTLSNTLVLAKVNAIVITDADISGGIYLGTDVYGAGTVVTNGNFTNGNIGGHWNDATFSGGSFINVTFNGADLTGATGMSTATFTNVNWYGAKCPDSFQVTTLGGTCIGHGI